MFNTYNNVLPCTHFSCRKALALLQYLLSQYPQDVQPATQYGCLSPCATALQDAVAVASAAACHKGADADGFEPDEVYLCEIFGLD